MKAQERRAFESAAHATGLAMLPKDREQELKRGGDLDHLCSRLSTFGCLIDEEIKRFEDYRSRAAALALVLTSDFCWQVLRTLADRSGDDQSWIDVALPADWRESDQDIGHEYFGHQDRIVKNAKWIFSLHSALRHPKHENSDLVELLHDPVESAVGDRLISAAKEIGQVWLSIQKRIDRTVSVRAV